MHTVRHGCILYKGQKSRDGIDIVEPLVAKNICKKAKKKRSQNMLHNAQQPLLSKPVKSI